MSRLQGKIAVITGGGSRIGLATARRFAEEASRFAPGEPLTLLLGAQSAQLSGDRCVSFIPELWTKEGSITKSHRALVPVREAFDLKVHIVQQLNNQISEREGGKTGG